jgi:cytoskeletal protein RodZ
MAYETSPERPRIVRSVVRVVLLVGAIVAVWLIAPAAANALEPPTSPDDAVTEATDTVTDAADSAGNTIAEAEASVTDAADDVVSTVENAGDGAADVARPLQDAVSAVDVRDTISDVEANAKSGTAPDPTARRIDGGDGMAGPRDREDVTSLRLADEPALTSALTTGPVAAAAASDAGAAVTSSSGAAPESAATPDGVPPAMGSTARNVLGGDSSFDDLAAILAAIVIALGLVRWSRRENETVYSPVFLSLAARPG